MLTRLRVIAFTLIVLAFLGLQKPGAAAPDLQEVALSGLDYGASVGKLLWASVPQSKDYPSGPTNPYAQLATELKAKIDLGRASAGVIRGHFDFASTTLAYAAVVDPEPISKATAAVASHAP